MRAHWRFTDRYDGDFGSSVAPEELAARCDQIIAHPWTLLDQVHGSDVVVVGAPGQCRGVSADAAVTGVPGAALAVRTADCAGVVLIGSDINNAEIAVGVAHAGWKGLLDGVLQNTVGAMGDLGAAKVQWILGPCISALSYEFGVDDLALLMDRFGESLASRTASGSPALDLRAGVRVALGEAGALPFGGPGVPEPPCTAADDGYFSWRERSEVGRQATVVWLDAEDG